MPLNIPVSATVKGGFWEQYGATLTGVGTTQDERRAAAQKLFKDPTFRAALLALNGVAPGAAALSQYKRIVAVEELGGQRAIETVDNINRVTVAADVTDITADLLSYGGLATAVNVANLDGNPLGTR